MQVPVARPAARIDSPPPFAQPLRGQATITAAVAVLLFLSGAAGLVYQVAWVRLLGLTFGVTIYAISTVLAAFMGGLAIGSVVGGRRADALARPLRVYGLVELAVGATAMLTPWAFGGLQPLYATVSGLADPTQAPFVAGVVRAVLAFVVLLAPTALMGATLPLAVRGVRGARIEYDPSRGDSWAMALLYATNTTGAILGCLVSGFVLIGWLGLGATIQAAAIANAGAGIGAITLDFVTQRDLRPRQNGFARVMRVEREPTRIDRRLARVALIAFAGSGAISLAYEVVWSRILAVLFDSSIYGFVLMLATVLLGIAVGGAFGGLVIRWRSRALTSGWLFGSLEIGIGLAAVLSVLAFGGAYDALTAWRGSGSALERFVRTDTRLMAMLCVVTVLPASLLMGATFPVAARLWAAGSRGLGRRLGGIYAGNVGGAIVGSLLAGFVLVPLLGADHSLLLLAILNVGLGSALLCVTMRRNVALLAGLAPLLLVGWAVTWPPLHEKVFHEHFPDQRLLGYWAGLETTVSVGRDAAGIQTLFTNSRGQTNDAPDLVRYHRLMGHLAALLAPRPDMRALVVGLGAGATPGALVQHAGAQVEVVELSESVVAAAPFFRAANADALSQPNLRLAIDDGRNFLLRNRQPYDVITADVVHPYDAGATNLYSEEYFALAARNLTPNGIMVQWVSPGSAFEHSLIIRTFLRAFPHATLWLNGDLLIGSPSPLRLSPAGLEQRLLDHRARDALAEVGLNHAPDVLSQYRAGPEALAAYVGDGPILTDDHPLLEYFLSLNSGLTSDPPDLTTLHSPPPVAE